MTTETRHELAKSILAEQQRPKNDDRPEWFDLQVATLVGPEGKAGLDGSDGVPGPQGEPGADGPQGDPGRDGSDGLQGPEGPQGPKGDKGDQGEKGERGDEGPRGPSGGRGGSLFGGRGGSGSGGSLTVKDEGVSQGAATTLDFAGAGVSVATVAGVSTVTVPGGGGDIADWVETTSVPGTLTITPPDAEVDDLVNIVVPETYVDDSNYGRMLRMAFASMSESEYIYSFGLDRFKFMSAPDEGEASISAASADSGASISMDTGNGFVFSALSGAGLLRLIVSDLGGLRALKVESTVGAAIFGAKSVVGDGSLELSEFTFYLDDTPGTAAPKWKAKDSAGTVVTGSVGLSGSAQTYTESNVTTDRAFNANATSIDELADVLGTLIADLRARGVVA